MDTKHHLKLVQGGLEIPVKVVIENEATTRNREIINKYKQLVVTSYKEPDRNGLFDDCTKDILQELQQEDDIDSDKENWLARRNLNKKHGQDNYVVN